MKTLLVLPPTGNTYGDFQKVAPTRPPLGLAYIAAILEKNNYKVEIFDGSLFNENDLKNRLVEYNPDVVGISITTLTVRESIKTARIVKEFNKNVLVIAGGPHVSISPDETMKYSEFDIGIIGEGEFAMLDLIKHIEGKIKDRKKIKGIVYRNKGKLIKTEMRAPIQNLDELPFPARHLLPDLKLYKQTPFKNARAPQTSMITSRGCPYNCIFCSEYPFKRIYRTHSAEYVISEIEHLINKYGIKEIAFQDDVFTLNKERVHKICDEIINRKLDITWSCWARVNIVDEELLKKMKDAGCLAISYGIEASTDEMLNYVNKGITIEQIKKVVNATSRVGIYNIGHFVIGYPNDNKETIKQRIEFAKSLPLDGATFTPLVPFPGSKMYEIAETTYGEYDKDYIYGESQQTYGSHSRPVYSPPGLTIDEMDRLRKKAYKDFYIRPKYIIRRLTKINSFNELKNLFKAGFNLASS